MSKVHVSYDLSSGPDMTAKVGWQKDRRGHWKIVSVEYLEPKNKTGK